MKTFDAGELIEHIDEVLCMVEEEGETIEITNHGQVIAHLVPVPEPRFSVESTNINVWSDLDLLASEIGKYWPADVSAVDAVRDVRREL